MKFKANGLIWEVQSVQRDNEKLKVRNDECLGVTYFKDLQIFLDCCQRQFEIARKRRRNFVVFRRGRVTKSAVALLKKSVHDLLFLAHKFLAFFQAVRLTLDVDNGAVMQYTIQNSGGDGDVGKDLIPLGEGLVGGKNGGRFLIPSGNELEKEICALDIHREIADFVNDEHPILGQNFELVRQAVIHELVHAFVFSFGVHLVANEKTEEPVCDFMGSHLDEIYMTANKIMAACYEKGVK